MKTIYKYTLAITDGPQIISMPVGAVIHGAAMQGMSPCLWAMVDTTAPVEDRTFHLIGTGHPLPEAKGLIYCGAPIQQGPFVWHIVEV